MYHLAACTTGHARAQRRFVLSIKTTHSQCCGALSLCDSTEQSDTFSTHAQSVACVFDIAAQDHTAVTAMHGRTDSERGVWAVGTQCCATRLVDEGVRLRHSPSEQRTLTIAAGQQQSTDFRPIVSGDLGEAFTERVDRGLDVAIRVGQGCEAGLKCRWGQINPALEHGPVQATKAL